MLNPPIDLSRAHAVPTSQAAHATVAPRKQRLWERILTLMESRGTLTLSEASEALDIPVNSLSGRFTELRAAVPPLIVRTDERRTNARGNAEYVYMIPERFVTDEAGQFQMFGGTQ